MLHTGLTLVVVFFGATLHAAAIAPAGATIHEVLLQHDRFEPAQLSIRAGDTVHWVWVVNVHNVESGTVDGFKLFPDGRFRSGDPQLDGSFELTFDAAFLAAAASPDSLFPYYCVVHYFVGMVGVIEVVVPGDADLDTDVDLDDVPGLTACLNGPDSFEFPPGCAPDSLARADADEDGDVDLRDVAHFQEVAVP